MGGVVNPMVFRAGITKYWVYVGHIDYIDIYSLLNTLNERIFRRLANKLQKRWGILYWNNQILFLPDNRVIIKIKVHENKSIKKQKASAHLKKKERGWFPLTRSLTNNIYIWQKHVKRFHATRKMRQGHDARGNRYRSDLAKKLAHQIENHNTRLIRLVNTTHNNPRIASTPEEARYSAVFNKQMRPSLPQGSGLDATTFDLILRFLTQARISRQKQKVKKKRWLTLFFSQLNKKYFKYHSIFGRQTQHTSTLSFLALNAGVAKRLNAFNLFKGWITNKNTRYQTQTAATILFSKLNSQQATAALQLRLHGYLRHSWAGKLLKTKKLYKLQLNFVRKFIRPYWGIEQHVVCKENQNQIKSTTSELTWLGLGRYRASLGVNKQRKKQNTKPKQLHFSNKATALSQRYFLWSRAGKHLIEKTTRNTGAVYELVTKRRDEIKNKNFNITNQLVPTATQLTLDAASLNTTYRGVLLTSKLHEAKLPLSPKQLHKTSYSTQRSQTKSAVALLVKLKTKRLLLRGAHALYFDNVLYALQRTSKHYYLRRLLFLASAHNQYRRRESYLFYKNRAIVGAKRLGTEVFTNTVRCLHATVYTPARRKKKLVNHTKFLLSEQFQHLLRNTYDSRKPYFNLPHLQLKWELKGPDRVELPRFAGIRAKYALLALSFYANHTTLKKKLTTLFNLIGLSPRVRKKSKGLKCFKQSSSKKYANNSELIVQGVGVLDTTVGRFLTAVRLRLLIASVTPGQRMHLVCVGTPRVRAVARSFTWNIFFSSVFILLYFLNSTKSKDFFSHYPTVSKKAIGTGVDKCFTFVKFVTAPLCYIFMYKTTSCHEVFNFLHKTNKFSIFYTMLKPKLTLNRGKAFFYNQLTTRTPSRFLPASSLALDTKYNAIYKQYTPRFKAKKTHKRLFFNHILYIHRRRHWQFLLKQCRKHTVTQAREKILGLNPHRRRYRKYISEFAVYNDPHYMGRHSDAQGSHNALWLTRRRQLRLVALEKVSKRLAAKLKVGDFTRRHKGLLSFYTTRFKSIRMFDSFLNSSRPGFRWYKLKGIFYEVSLFFNVLRKHAITEKAKVLVSYYRNFFRNLLYLKRAGFFRSVGVLINKIAERAAELAAQREAERAKREAERARLEAAQKNQTGWLSFVPPFKGPQSATNTPMYKNKHRKAVKAREEKAREEKAREEKARKEKARVKAKKFAILVKDALVRTAKAEALIKKKTPIYIAHWFQPIYGHTLLKRIVSKTSGAAIAKKRAEVERLKAKNTDETKSMVTTTTPDTPGLKVKSYTLQDLFDPKNHKKRRIINPGARGARATAYTYVVGLFKKTSWLVLKKRTFVKAVILRHKRSLNPLAGGNAAEPFFCYNNNWIFSAKQPGAGNKSQVLTKYLKQKRKAAENSKTKHKRFLNNFAKSPLDGRDSRALTSVFHRLCRTAKDNFLMLRAFNSALRKQPKKFSYRQTFTEHKLPSPALQVDNFYPVVGDLCTETAANCEYQTKREALLALNVTAKVKSSAAKYARNLLRAPTTKRKCIFLRKRLGLSSIQRFKRKSNRVKWRVAIKRIGQGHKTIHGRLHPTGLLAYRKAIVSLFPQYRNNLGKLGYLHGFKPYEYLSTLNHKDKLRYIIELEKRHLAAINKSKSLSFNKKSRHGSPKVKKLKYNKTKTRKSAVTGKNSHNRVPKNWRLSDNNRVPLRDFFGRYYLAKGGVYAKLEDVRKKTTKLVSPIKSKRLSFNKKLKRHGAPVKKLSVTSTSGLTLYKHFRALKIPATYYRNTEVKRKFININFYLRFLVNFLPKNFFNRIASAICFNSFSSGFFLSQTRSKNLFVGSQEFMLFWLLCLPRKRLLSWLPLIIKNIHANTIAVDDYTTVLVLRSLLGSFAKIPTIVSGKTRVSLCLMSVVFQRMYFSSKFSVFKGINKASLKDQIKRDERRGLFFLLEASLFSLLRNIPRNKNRGSSEVHRSVYGAQNVPHVTRPSHQKLDGSVSNPGSKLILSSHGNNAENCLKKTRSEVSTRVNAPASTFGFFAGKAKQSLIAEVSNRTLNMLSNFYNNSVSNSLLNLLIFNYNLINQWHSNYGGLHNSYTIKPSFQLLFLNRARVLSVCLPFCKTRDFVGATLPLQHQYKDRVYLLWGNDFLYKENGYKYNRVMTNQFLSAQVSRSKKNYRAVYPFHFYGHSQIAQRHFITHDVLSAGYSSKFSVRFFFTEGQARANWYQKRNNYRNFVQQFVHNQTTKQVTALLLYKVKKFMLLNACVNSGKRKDLFFAVASDLEMFDVFVTIPSAEERRKKNYRAKHKIYAIKPQLCKRNLVVTLFYRRLRVHLQRVCLISFYQDCYFGQTKHTRRVNSATYNQIKKRPKLLSDNASSGLQHDHVFNLSLQTPNQAQRGLWTTFRAVSLNRQFNAEKCYSNERERFQMDTGGAYSQRFFLGKDRSIDVRRDAIFSHKGDVGGVTSLGAVTTAGHKPLWSTESLITNHIPILSIELRHVLFKLIVYVTTKSDSTYYTNQNTNFLKFLEFYPDGMTHNNQERLVYRDKVLYTRSVHLAQLQKMHSSFIFFERRKAMRFLKYCVKIFFQEFKNRVGVFLGYFLKKKITTEFLMSRFMRTTNASFMVAFMRMKTRKLIKPSRVLRVLTTTMAASTSHQGYRVELNGRFEKRKRATYKWRIVGRLDRRSYGGLLDYSWKSFTMKFGVCSIKLWVLRGKVNLYVLNALKVKEHGVLTAFKVKRLGLRTLGGERHLHWSTKLFGGLNYTASRRQMQVGSKTSNNEIQNAAVRQLTSHRRLNERSVSSNDLKTYSDTNLTQHVRGSLRFVNNFGLEHNSVLINMGVRQKTVSKLFYYHMSVRFISTSFYFFGCDALFKKYKLSCTVWWLSGTRKRSSYNFTTNATNSRRFNVLRSARKDRMFLFNKWYRRTLGRRYFIGSVTEQHNIAMFFRRICDLNNRLTVKWSKFSSYVNASTTTGRKFTYYIMRPRKALGEASTYINLLYNGQRSGFAKAYKSTVTQHMGTVFLRNKRSMCAKEVHNLKKIFNFYKYCITKQLFLPVKSDIVVKFFNFKLLRADIGHVTMYTRTLNMNNHFFEPYNFKDLGTFVTSMRSWFRVKAKALLYEARGLYLVRCKNAATNACNRGQAQRVLLREIDAFSNFFNYTMNCVFFNQFAGVYGRAEKNTLIVCFYFTKLSLYSEFQESLQQHLVKNLMCHLESRKKLLNILPVKRLLPFILLLERLKAVLLCKNTNLCLKLHSYVLLFTRQVKSVLRKRIDILFGVIVKCASSLYVYSLVRTEMRKVVILIDNYVAIVRESIINRSAFDYRRLTICLFTLLKIKYNKKCA